MSTGFEFTEALSAPSISRDIIAHKRQADMVSASKKGSETC